MIVTNIKPTLVDLTLKVIPVSKIINFIIKFNYGIR